MSGDVYLEDGSGNKRHLGKVTEFKISADLDPHPLRLQHYREESNARTVVRCTCGCKTFVYINDEVVATRKQINYERDGIKAALQEAHDAYWRNQDFPYVEESSSALSVFQNGIKPLVKAIDVRLI